MSAAAPPPPPPPAIVAAPVMFGRVTVRVGARTTRLAALLDGRVRRSVRVAPGPRRVTLTLPVGRWNLAVRATGPGGSRRSATRVVWVLPAAGARVGTTTGRLDRRLQGTLQAMADGLPAVSGIYVQNLVTGCGAAVNAGAQFPAASTLKAAILTDAVRRPAGAPADLLDDMILNSSDQAANRVLALQGGGNGVAGAGRVTETMALMGMSRSLVRRPYILDEPGTVTARERVPVTTVRQPALATNFISTPYDLAAMMVALHRGALGRGAVRRMGIGMLRARAEISRRLLDVRDRSKIVAGVPSGTPVMHKTGYTTQVKHDAGIVYLPRGPVVVSVMTWDAGGVPDGRGDAFIARVAGAAVDRLSGGGACRR